MYPFMDASSGDSPDGVVTAYDRVLALAGERTKIIPGHMLATVIKRVADLRRAGRTESEVVAAKPCADFDARFGGCFIKHDAFIAMVLAGVGR